MRVRFAHLNRLLPLLLALVAAPLRADDGAEFFEKRVRPLLMDKCLECHSADKKVKGGLRLDLREGWAVGGDSGPALVPGKPEESLLIKAVHWKDSDFQMPPKNKLSDAEIATLEQWIRMGAPDPRAATAVAAPSGMDVESGRSFWAYQLPLGHAPPAITNGGARTDIDRFVFAKLEENQISPAAPASREALIRRLHFDLLGLPPTPEQISSFIADNAPGATDRLVEQLLQSPHFGERWARHWFDIVRYGQSVGLRGFVFKEAWRYRDYVIESFNEDRPLDEMLREHIAGDLLEAENLKERQRQLIATTFLAMGNTNLEEQDKKQLDMDVVDEQLDTIGKAFLGQTIGCARCHDHKFDPIPTRDYYAMAGAFKNSVALKHANLSEWIEVPLPLPADQEARLKEHEEKLAALQEGIKATKESIRLLTAKRGSNNADTPEVISPSSLPGVVVDSAQAKKVGEWKHSVHSKRFIGDGYLHDENTGKGEKTLSFAPELPKAGLYEIRFAYTYADSRAAKTPITIFHAGGETVVHANLKNAPPIDGRFVSLGRFHFENNGFANVLVSNEGTSGFVTADAVQFLLLDDKAAAQPNLAAEVRDELTADLVRLTAELTAQEARLKELNAVGIRRPMTMSLKEAPKIEECRIHIRGTVHNLGAEAPRGVLTVALHGAAPSFSTNQSGRLQIADWIASTNNPLTARVYVNRVWLWLMGEGLVRTPDNFNTSGEPPSHPELLDYLALRFMENGWSTKALVRDIVSSAVYQQSGKSTNSKAEMLDPENRLLWRANQRRLPAESLRDAILFASGKLDLAMGGANHPPALGSDYAYPFTDNRRSVYVPAFRNTQPAIFENFDAPNTGMVVGQRTVSSVPTQALFFMNNPWVHTQAKEFGKRIASSGGVSVQEKLSFAWRTALGREPHPAELSLTQAHVSQHKDAPETWAEIAQMLFASLDFRYIN